MRPRSLAAGVVAAALAAGSVGGCAWLDAKQREWIFQPSREDVSGRWGAAPEYEDVWIAVGGERLHGWWVAQGEHADAPTLLYLHGARWNVTGASFRIERLSEVGFKVLAIDYRGFGRSDGSLPSEQMAYEDAQAAWDWVKRKEPDPAKRFVYGHSLGGAVAIDLAARNPDVAGLIVESSFTSIADLAAQMKYGWLPFSALLTQHFDSLTKIGSVRAPKLFIHGTADRVVPTFMSERLYARASEPKALLKIEGASHSGASRTDPERYARAVRALIEAARGSAKRAPA